MSFCSLIKGVTPDVCSLGVWTFYIFGTLLIIVYLSICFWGFLGLPPKCQHVFCSIKISVFFCFVFSFFKLVCACVSCFRTPAVNFDYFQMPQNICSLILSDIFLQARIWGANGAKYHLGLTWNLGWFHISASLNGNCSVTYKFLNIYNIIAC